jgi:hypothetical protein
MCKRVSRFDFGKADVDEMIGRLFSEATVSTSAFRSFMMLFTSALNMMLRNT